MRIGGFRGSDSRPRDSPSKQYKCCGFRGYLLYPEKGELIIDGRVRLRSSSFCQRLRSHKLGGMSERPEVTELTFCDWHRLLGKLDKRRRISTRVSVHQLEKRD